MKILGIDPGTTESGVAIYDTDSHTVPYMGIVDNEALLRDVMPQPFDVVAIEMVASYGMPVGATTFETVYWIGRFAERCMNWVGEENVFRYYKKTDINPTICFNPNVKDKNISAAIQSLFPQTGGGSKPAIGTKSQPGVLYGIKSHIFPALAVAMTHALKNNIVEYKQYD